MSILIRIATPADAASDSLAVMAARQVADFRRYLRAEVGFPTRCASDWPRLPRGTPTPALRLTYGSERLRALLRKTCLSAEEIEAAA